MTIGFRNIPPGLRAPLFYAELDASRANDGDGLTGVGLIIGQMITATSAPNGFTAFGDATPNIALQNLSTADARARFGVGSQLALMVAAYRLRDPYGPLYCLPLADDGSAVAATGTIVFTGSSTSAGTISAYVGGVLVPVPVASGATAAQAATAVAAAVNAATDMPVIASVTAGTVTLTALNKGVCGNEIDLRLNYQGSAGGEATPAGLTAVATTATNGAVNPTLTAGLASLGDQPFDYIASAYTDATSLNALQSLLSDTAGRWSYATGQLFGGVFSAYRGTAGACTTFGTGRNDQHASVMGFNDSPSPAWIWAANFCGAAAASLRADPALPLQTLALDVLPPPPSSRFTLTQRNLLLYDGVSTFNVVNGVVTIESAITTYQKNGQGQADDSYLQVETLYALAEVIRRFRALVVSKYGRVKLADNGTRIPPGVNAVAPITVKGDLIALYQSMEGDLVENSDAFAANLIVERDPSNRRRLNVLLPADIIDSLGVFAVLTQFIA